MTVDELLPCPCCGGDELEINSWRAFWGKLAYQSRISCKCGVQMLAFGSTKEDAEAQASRKWNERYEHTCHMVFRGDPKRDDHCHCDACGACFDLDDCVGWIGGQFNYAYEYCTECGAKVVDE